MASLYDLTGEFMQLSQMASDDDPAFNDTLDAVMGDIEAKSDDYAYVISSIDDQIEAAEKEVARVSSILKNLKNHKSMMKDRLYNAMKAMNTDEIRTTFHTFKIKKAGGKQKLVLDKDDPKQFPKKYQKKVIEIDSDALRNDLESGIELTCAHLEERKEILSIK